MPKKFELENLAAKVKSKNCSVYASLCDSWHSLVGLFTSTLFLLKTAKEKNLIGHISIVPSCNDFFKRSIYFIIF